MSEEVFADSLNTSFIPVAEQNKDCCEVHNYISSLEEEKTFVRIFLLPVFSSICKIFLLPVFSICNIQLYTHLNFPNINKLNVPLFFFLVRVIFIYGHESLDVDCGDVNIVCVHLSSHAKAELYIFS